MVVGNHLFSFFDKKFREGVTWYESHPPSLRTVYFLTAPFDTGIIKLIEQISLHNVAQLQLPVYIAHWYRPVSGFYPV